MKLKRFFTLFAVLCLLTTLVSCKHNSEDNGTLKGVMRLGGYFETEVEFVPGDNTCGVVRITEKEGLTNKPVNLLRTLVYDVVVNEKEDGSYSIEGKLSSACGRIEGEKDAVEIYRKECSNVEKKVFFQGETIQSVKDLRKFTSACNTGIKMDYTVEKGKMVISHYSKIYAENNSAIISPVEELQYDLSKDNAVKFCLYQDGNLNRTEEYEYYPGGMLIKEAVSYHLIDKKSEGYTEYNASGRCKKSYSLYSDGNEYSYEYFYDGAGFCIKNVSKTFIDNEYEKRTSLMTNTSNYDARHNEKEKEVVSDGELLHKETRKFDNAHNCTELTEYKKDGSVYAVTENKYDNKGNCIEERRKKSDGTVQITSFEYDENNILRKSISNDGDIVYEYNQEGNHIRTTTYSRFDLISQVQSKEYDESGNLIKDTTTDRDGKVVSMTVFSSYNEYGNFLEKTECGKNGKVLKSERFEYDENGFFVKRVN